MKNIPDVKLGIVVGSTDWLPSDVAIENRKKLVDIYKAKYGEENIYEEKAYGKAIRNLYPSRSYRPGEHLRKYNRH